MKGTYILLIRVGRDAECRIGALGKMKFRKGFYAYAGSGMGSLEKRVGRHFKKSGKKRFWHIDYLLEKAKAEKAIFWESEVRDECRAAEKLARKFQSVKNFGCSDCKCESHLFFSEKQDEMEKVLADISRSFGAPRLPLPSPLRPWVS